MKFKIIPIAGDASFRKFYRININGKSKILVNAQREKYKNLVAYVAVNKFLIKNKILAPKLFESNYTNGTIIIEDFGDLSFHQLLLKQKKNYQYIKNL